MKPNLIRALSTTLVCLAACAERPGSFDPRELECGALPDGWQHASAVSPDVVPPCQTGSTGICPDSGYVYVPGTAMCRPK